MINSLAMCSCVIDEAYVPLYHDDGQEAITALDQEVCISHR